jgi:hypothetical protein
MASGSTAECVLVDWDRDLDAADGRAVLGDHCASAPPSMTTSLPVMYDDSSEAR